VAAVVARERQHAAPHSQIAQAVALLESSTTPPDLFRFDAK
jgi:hypothetical protein